MSINNFRHNRQAESDSGFLRGDKWIENLLPQIRGDARSRVFNFDDHSVVSVGTRLLDIHPQAAAALPHGVISVLHNVDERLLAKTLIKWNHRQIWSIVFLDSNRLALPQRCDIGQCTIEDCGDVLRRQIRMQRTGKIEEARHQRAQPVGLGRNISRQFRGERIRFSDLLREHLRRALDYAEGISNLVRKPSRKLAQRGQALGATGVGLRLFETTVGFSERLSQFLVTPRLAPVLDHKAVNQQCRQKEKQNANRQQPKALLRDLHILHRGIEKKIGAVCSRGQGSPKQSCPGPKIFRSSDYRQKIDRPVTAIDGDLAGVVDQQGRECNLQENEIGRAALRQAPDQPPLAQLEEPEAQQDSLLMDLLDGWQKSQSRQEYQPKNVHPVDGGTSGFVHSRAKKARQKRLRRERSRTPGVAFIHCLVRKCISCEPYHTASEALASMPLRLVLFRRWRRMGWWRRTRFLPRRWRRRSRSRLLPLVELLFLLLLLLLIALLYRRRRVHQRMRLLHRRPGGFLLLQRPVGFLIPVLGLRHSILWRLHVAVLRLRGPLLFVSSRVGLRHLPDLIIVVAIRRSKRPEAILRWARPRIHRRGLRRASRTHQRLLIETPTRLCLPLLDRTRRRRWRADCNHRAADHGRRRTHAHRTPRSNHAGAYWLRLHHVRYGRSRELARFDFHDVLRHRPRVHERIVRNDRDSIAALVDVGDVVDGRALVHDYGVIDVRDTRDIHRRVGDVHVIHVRAADAVSGDIDLPGSEREPSHAHANRKVEARSTTYERHECRRPNGPNDDRPRNPEPSAIHGRPASIVEGRKSPRLIFNPGPSPRANVDPVTEAIRCPSHGDGTRTPARTVAGDVTPVAVLVEIFVPGHLTRNIVRGIRAIFPVVAVESPSIEIIAVGDLAEIVIEVIVVAGEGRRLIPDHSVCKSAARNAATAVPDRRNRLTAIFAYIETILTGLQQTERDVRRIDFVGVVIVNMTNFKDQ